jgi:hypothetical protein
VKKRLKKEKYDDYDMLEEYDFSDGVRGRFYEAKMNLKPTCFRSNKIQLNV